MEAGVTVGRGVGVLTGVGAVVGSGSGVSATQATKRKTTRANKKGFGSIVRVQVYNEQKYRTIFNPGTGMFKAIPQLHENLQN